jgi:hypothetical protein
LNNAQLEVLEDLVVTKKPYALSSNTTDMIPYTSLKTKSNVHKPDLEDYNEDGDANESEINPWSVEDLTAFLKKILGKKWEKVIDQALKDGEGLSDRIVERKKQPIFKALLKLDPSVVSKKLKTETKYSILDQFIQRSFTDDDKIKRNEDRLTNQVSIDLNIRPLGNFFKSLSDMYEKNADLEDAMEGSQDILDRVMRKVYEPHIPQELKKEIVLAYLRKIGGFVAFFKEHEDVFVMKNSAKKFAEKAGLTSTFIQKMIKISGMNKMDEEDEGYSDSCAVNDFAQLLYKEGVNGANNKKNTEIYSAKRKSKLEGQSPAA